MPKRLLLAASFVSTLLMSLAATPVNAVLTATHPIASTACGASQSAPHPKAIASQARKQAMSMCTNGFCFRGVKRALNSLGVSLTGSEAWMARAQLSHDKRFSIVPGRSLRQGDILVHGKSKVHPYGHIAIYLGDGQEASDHVQKLVLGGRYGTTVVFRTRADAAKIHGPSSHGLLASR